MRFIHLSDLHLGKRVNEFSMIEDQHYILTEILNIIENQKIQGESPDGVIIAGDIYDKAVPSAEAVKLFDDFLVRLNKKSIPVFIISGNHDSAERIAFASRLMSNSQVYVSPVYNGKIEPVVIEDQYGTVNIYLLPFIKPAHVRVAFPEDEEALKIQSYTEGIAFVIDKMKIDSAKRNILVTHQFITGSKRCESEEITIGGSDNVNAAVLEVFDYVALGHLHGAQNAWGERVRYCGSPLKYSFSETKQEKSVTVVELREKGDLKVSVIPLVPLRDMIEIKGTYDEIISSQFTEEIDTKSFFHITLTDEEDVPNALGNLRVVYPNLMKLDYDNSRTRASGAITPEENAENISPVELFRDFYEKQNGRELSEEQKGYLKEIIEQIWRGQE